MMMVVVTIQIIVLSLILISGSIIKYVLMLCVEHPCRRTKVYLLQYDIYYTIKSVSVNI